MRIQVEPHADLKAAPRSLYRGERRIDIIEIMDQWYGPGYRYVKVRGHDSTAYILLFDEIRDQWELIMFSSAQMSAFGGKADITRTERRNVPSSPKSKVGHPLPPLVSV
jgi:hypothetical protein